jgi:hypothetical protein
VTGEFGRHAESSSNTRDVWRNQPPRPDIDLAQHWIDKTAHPPTDGLSLLVTR